MPAAGMAAGAPSAAVPSGASASPVQRGGGLAAQQSQAGSAQIGASLPAQQFHAKDSNWRQIPGRASESPQARAAFAALQDLVRQYPTEQALTAAGYRLAPGSTNHYEIPRDRRTYDDGQVHIAHLIVENGRVTGAQFDSNARQVTDPPPAWSGVQWHYHDHGKASWMFHVSAQQPIDTAFIESKSGGGHH